MPTPTKRLASIDALRGFTMFLLVIFGPFFSVVRKESPLADFFSSEGIGSTISGWFGHVPWEGFVLWDLLMPLFVFCAGLSIPFQFAKYRTQDGSPNYLKIYLRILRRVVVLWIFGMIMQGNFLDFHWSHGLRLFSNTLQTIAVGYLFASIFYLHFRVRFQVGICVALMLAYWALMAFVSVTGVDGIVYGAGSYAPDSNLCEWVDRVVLGPWRDCVSFNEDGTWAFSESYRYTWILSSLTFICTALTGVFSGELIRRNPLSRPETQAENASEVLPPAEVQSPSKMLSGTQIFVRLLIIGLAMLTVGWGWSKIPEGTCLYCPLVKHIWTPTMVLWASGWSVLLLAVFYEIIDVLNFRAWSIVLTVPGMNSITAYMMPKFVGFAAISQAFLYGTEPFFGAWYPTVKALGAALLFWFFLWHLYRTKTFLRV